MKKIDLGQTLQLLGNLGVIVGILLLVYELNQNSEMTRAQTRNELSQGLIEILMGISGDDESASIVLRGDRGEELTEIARQRYENMTISQLRYHENVYYQYRSGLYDETEYLAQREMWRINVFAEKGLAELFCELRHGFSPEFVAEIDGILTTYRCD